MQKKGEIPDPLSKDELRKLVLEALEKAPGAAGPETFHARFGHLERGISIDDVIHGLERKWQFGRSPRFSKDFWQWKYEIATETIEGDPLTIIVAVDTRNRSFEVITRWRDDHTTA